MKKDVLEVIVPSLIFFVIFARDEIIVSEDETFSYLSAICSPKKASEIELLSQNIVSSIIEFSTSLYGVLGLFIGIKKMPFIEIN